jgi:hypothetical protein
VGSVWVALRNERRLEAAAGELATAA